MGHQSRLHTKDNKCGGDDIKYYCEKHTLGRQLYNVWTLLRSRLGPIPQVAGNLTVGWGMQALLTEVGLWVAVTTKDCTI